MRLAIVVMLAACGESDVQPSPDAAPPDAPAGCTSPQELAEVRLTISGVVRDFTSGAPVAGATVDVARAWSTRGFPGTCPMLATLTADAEGRFGPIEIDAGPKEGLISNGQFLVFLVHGAGVAQTASDAKFTCSRACTLAPHTIRAPSAELATRWRADLAATGMPDAATRGLVAFSFEELDDAAAPNVEAFASGSPFSALPLVIGTQVRYVAADGELAPIADVRTSARGVAVIGINFTDPDAIYVSGRRGADHWLQTGSIVAPGWIFIEDRNVSPPM